MQSGSQTMVQKVLARQSGTDHVAPGEIVLAKVNLAVANDITAPLALKQMRAAGAEDLFDPSKVCFVAGRHAPFRDSATAKMVADLGRYGEAQGLRGLFTHGEGMDHVVLPEEGLIDPGMLVCNGDSHAASIGGFGAIGIPMGSTDMAYIFVFGETWLQVPETIKAEFTGTPGAFVTTKDLILALLGRVGVDGANYMALEFTGVGPGGVLGRGTGDAAEHVDRDGGQDRCDRADAGYAGLAGGAERGRVGPSLPRPGCGLLPAHCRRDRHVRASGRGPTFACQRASGVELHQRAAGPGQHRHLHQWPRRGYPAGCAAA